MAEGHSEFIITLKVTVPNEDGYTYVDPVKWNWTNMIQATGAIRHGTAEILNVSPIRNVDLPDDTAVFYEGAARERQEWEDNRG